MTASAGARGIWPLATPPTSLSLTLARRSACRAATALGEGGGDSVKSIAPCAADPPVPHPSALPPPTSCTVLLRFAPPPAAHAGGSEGAGAGLCPGTEISLARTRSGSGGMMAAGGDLIISFWRWLPLGSDCAACDDANSRSRAAAKSMPTGTKNQLLTFLSGLRGTSTCTHSLLTLKTLTSCERLRRWVLVYVCVSVCLCQRMRHSNQDCCVKGYTHRLGIVEG